MDKRQYLFGLPEPSLFAEVKSYRSEDGICYESVRLREQFIDQQYDLTDCQLWFIIEQYFMLPLADDYPDEDFEKDYNEMLEADRAQHQQNFTKLYPACARYIQRTGIAL